MTHKDPEARAAYRKQYRAANPDVRTWDDRRATQGLRRDQRRAIIREAKDRPCVDCGQSYPWYVMDFDHVRGQKLANISAAAFSWSVPKLLEEMAKCDVVCSNCHRVRTFERLDKPDRLG
jgi:hypothetical protein